MDLKNLPVTNNEEVLFYRERNGTIVITKLENVYSGYYYFMSKTESSKITLEVIEYDKDRELVIDKVRESIKSRLDEIRKIYE